MSSVNRGNNDFISNFGSLYTKSGVQLPEKRLQWDSGGFKVDFYAATTKASPSRINSHSRRYAAISRYGKPIVSTSSHRIGEMMINSESINASPSTKAANVKTTSEATAIIAEADLVTALQQLLQEHELDQNFPQDILNRIRDFLDKQKSHGLVTDLELARTLLDEYHEQRNLALNHSAYPEVRAVVDPTDDPTLPVATFRVFLLGTIFTVFGTAIQQFFSFRMPAINITTYVIQLLSMPLGVGMAKWLPRQSLTIKQWTFSLNPGRFNEKEHLLIAIMANVAFAGYMHGAYIASPIQVLSLDLFYGEKVLSNSATWQITTFIATQMLGYGCAGISRRFLVSPPSMIWPRPLANIALTKALHKDDAIKDAQEAANGWTISRYRFFLVCFWAMFV